MCIDVYKCVQRPKVHDRWCLPQFLSTFCMHVHVGGIYVYAYVYMHVCAWRPEEDIIRLALVLSVLPFEARSLIGLRACCFSARLVDYQVPEILLFPYPLALGLQAHVPWPGFYVCGL